jgi:hypothetical protein
MLDDCSIASPVALSSRSQAHSKTVRNYISYTTASSSPSDHLQHVLLLLLKLLQDDISRLLGDHVCRDSRKSARNLGENRSVNDTQTSSPAYPKARIKDSHFVIIGTNGARRRGVVAPSSVLCVLRDAFLGSDILTGEDLLDLDELALERVAGEVDGLVERGEVLLVVADTSVEVVVDDLRGVQGICGAELDGPCVVARVGLEDRPGEPVVVGRGVDAVAGEVTAEVDGAAEDEEIELVVLGYAGLVEHGGTDAGGGVDAAVAEDGCLPTLQALVLGAAVESAAAECDEVGGSFALDVDLVVVLEVGADTGKVDDDGDVKLLKLGGGTDTAELEELRRVVGSAGDDDLARSSCGSSDASIAAVLGAGLVEILTVEELDTSGARRRRLVEGDLGYVAVGPDIWSPR